MKKLIIPLILSVFVLACNSETQSKDQSSNPSKVNQSSGKDQNIIAQEVEDISAIDSPDCESKTVENFNQFLGVKYSTKESMLKKYLGEFTGGEYTADSSAFIYFYNRVKRTPISVWVNAETGEVETIFMEVLSFDEQFKMDLNSAVEEFDISTCDASWFGLVPREIKARMGEPAEEFVDEHGITSLAYDSEEFRYSVTFKCYPQQGNSCSSVSVNWFYSDELP